MTRKQQTSLHLFWRGFAVAMLATGAWALLSFLNLKLFEFLYYQFHLLNVQERGYFGELFGAVNSLTSVLAFSAIIFTLWAQNLQYRDQTKRDSEAARVRQSVALFRCWNATETLGYRLILEKFLTATGASAIDPRRLAYGSAQDRALYGAMVGLVAFFVEWSALVTSANADGQLLKELLGDQAQAWKIALFDRLELSASDIPTQRVIADFGSGMFFQSTSERDGSP